MGIEKFSDLIKKVPSSEKHIPITFFYGKRVAVDLSIIKHKTYASAYKEVVEKTNLFVTDPDLDRVTEVYIRIFLTQLFVWLNNGITPVIVLDGLAPESKNATKEERKQDKIENIRKYNALLIEQRSLDMQYQHPYKLTELRKLCVQAYYIDNNINDLSVEICKTIGLPVLQAKYEAEWLCCSLYHENYVTGVFSNDTDNYVHSCRCVLTKFGDDVSKNNQKIKTLVSVDIPVLLAGLGINFTQFVDCCILAGCDYNKRIRQIGKKNKIAMSTGFNLIKKYGCLEQIPNLENGYLLNVYECRNNFTPKQVNYNYDGELGIEKLNINLKILSNPTIREDFSACKIEAYMYKLDSCYKSFPEIPYLTTPHQQIEYIEDCVNNIAGFNSQYIPIIPTKQLTSDQLFQQYQEQFPDLIFTANKTVNNNNGPVFVFDSSPVPVVANSNLGININFNFGDNNNLNFGTSSNSSNSNNNSNFANNNQANGNNNNLNFGNSNFGNSNNNLNFTNSNFGNSNNNSNFANNNQANDNNNNLNFGNSNFGNSNNNSNFGNNVPENSNNNLNFGRNTTSDNFKYNTPTEMGYLYSSDFQSVTDQDIFNFSSLSVSKPKQEFIPSKSVSILKTDSKADEEVIFVV